MTISPIMGTSYYNHNPVAAYTRLPHRLHPLPQKRQATLPPSFAIPVNPPGSRQAKNLLLPNAKPARTANIGMAPTRETSPLRQQRILIQRHLPPA